MQDVTLLDNHAGLFWELSQGPFEASRVLSASDVLSLYMYNVSACSISDSIISTGRKERAGISHFLFRMGGSDRSDPHAQLLIGVFQDYRISAKNMIFHASPGFARNVFHYRDERDSTRSEYKPCTYRGENNVILAPSNDLPVTFDIRKMEVVTDGANREQDKKRGWGERVPLAQWLNGVGYTGSETNARNIDPGFVDPLNNDFRFLADSPLAADSARYLQVTLTPEQRAELKEYLTGGWLDYKD